MMCNERVPENHSCCQGGSGHKHGHEQVACNCGGNFPRHFVFPAVLLLLNEEPSHGYSLFKKLAEIGIAQDEMSPATVYRILSRLEEEGLAVHEHVDQGQGPTRKVYMLTDEGRSALASWSSRLEQAKGMIAWFNKRYSGKGRSG